jgi:alpha-glucosidase (family GH31 glycosyl hydrolase)
MEDADIPEADWTPYDPSSAAIQRNEAKATGVPLAHLTSFPRSGAVSRDRTVVVAGNAADVRVQVLSDRLVRVEVVPTGKSFEDRPSFCFSQRGNESVIAPEFESRDHGDEDVVITTRALCVTVRTSSSSIPYIAATLHGDLLSSPCATPREFVFDPAAASVGGDLQGTCRTLDEADGYARRDWSTHARRRDVLLANGLLQRDGVSFVDDSDRPVFTDNGWFAPRTETGRAAAGYADVYVLACGHDYVGALNAFTRAAGPIPMVPRRYLGNWWSRYYAYDEAELRALVTKFQVEMRTPLSVVIVDMDWHLVKKEDGVAETSDGWTGFTWNKRLFPDPPAFISWLHNECGVGTALNFHPADGVHSHEEQYDAYAEFIGATDLQAACKPIPFDLTDVMLASAYFSCLIHPLEETAGDLRKWGVWMDWQHGSSSLMPGVDPLFLLNHLHFLDMDRGADRRPSVFSRYAGPGSHRTPIGFSGDTWADWESLAYQPYMTATGTWSLSNRGLL